MELKRKAFMAAFGLMAAGLVSSTALADTRWENNHPRQDQVLDRAVHQRHEIRQERRDGELSGPRAHRLMVRENRIAREEHRMAHAHGGYIGKRQQRALDRQEDQAQHQIRG